MVMDKDLFADPLYRIDSRQLRHFLAAAKCKGFTAAAESLNITQPALSRSIQALEQSLGVKLIERSSKVFDLTRYGHLLFEKGRYIETELGHTVSEIEALKRGHTGKISLGVGYASVSYLAEVIHEFQTLRPNISLRVVTDSMEANYEALLAGKLDLICTALNFPSNSSLIIDRTVTSRNIILVSSDHALATKKAVDPAELTEYPWAFFTDDRMGYKRVSTYFAANGVEPPSATVEINTIEGMCALLKRGQYIASAPAIVMRYVKETGITLCEAKTRGDFWSTEIGIAYPRQAQRPGGLDSLIGLLKKQLTSLEANHPLK